MTKLQKALKKAIVFYGREFKASNISGMFVKLNPFNWGVSLFILILCYRGIVTLNITITDSAQTYLSKLLSQQDVPGTGIRLYVAQPGTTHAETCLAYCKPGEQKKDDQLIPYRDFSCYLEKSSESYLDDAYIDYIEDKLGGQLTIKAPNAKVPMINESSSLEEQVNYILQTEINPNLAAHGGMVNLVKIDEKVAVLQFGGGCQGCGMIDLTLKDGIEKTLLETVPGLEGVDDVTDHTFRENAYDKS